MDSGSFEGVKSSAKTRTDLVLAEEIGPSSTPPLLGSFVVPNSQNLPPTQAFSIGSHRQRCSSRVFNPGPEPPVGASSQVAGLLREDGMGCQVPQLLVPADHTSGQWGFSLIVDSPGPGSLKMVMSAVFRSIAADSAASLLEISVSRLLPHHPFLGLPAL